MAKASKPKTPKNSPDRPGHRGGLLLSGNPGNKGGTGRPPSELRDQLRGSFADRITTLEQFADGTLGEDTSDRLKALDMLAKYGLGTLKEVSVENVRERVQGTLTVIRKHASPEQAAAIIAEMRPLWA